MTNKKPPHSPKPIFAEQLDTGDDGLPEEWKERLATIEAETWLCPVSLLRVATTLNPGIESCIFNVQGDPDLDVLLKRVTPLQTGPAVFNGGDSKRDIAVSMIFRQDRLTANCRFSEENSFLVPFEGDWMLFANAQPQKEMSIGQRQSAFPTTKNSRLSELFGESSDDPGDLPPIDIMVAYTDLAVEWVNTNFQNQTIEEIIAEAITNINDEIYPESGIKGKLRLVHTHWSPCMESFENFCEGMHKDLYSLTEPGTALALDIHPVRDNCLADVVVFLGCYWTCEGEAREILADEATAFTTNTILLHPEPPLSLTLAHEIGHLQGASHQDIDTVNDPFTYGNAFCFYFEGIRFQTVVARTDLPAFDFDGAVVYSDNPANDLVRIPLYSGPNATWKVKTGVEVPVGSEDLFDNARVINETWRIIAAFRPAQLRIFPLVVCLPRFSSARFTVSVLCNDNPIPGASIALFVSDSTRIQVPTRITTDADGTATVRVRSKGRVGSAVLTVESKGGGAKATVKIV